MSSCVASEEGEGRGSGVDCAAEVACGVLVGWSSGWESVGGLSGGVGMVDAIVRVMVLRALMYWVCGWKLGLRKRRKEVRCLEWFIDCNCTVVECECALVVAICTIVCAVPLPTEASLAVLESSVM